MDLKRTEWCEKKCPNATTCAELRCQRMCMVHCGECTPTPGKSLMDSNANTKENGRHYLHSTPSQQTPYSHLQLIAAGPLSSGALVTRHVAEVARAAFDRSSRRRKMVAKIVPAKLWLRGRATRMIAQVYMGGHKNNLHFGT